MITRTCHLLLLAILLALTPLCPAADEPATAATRPVLRNPTIAQAVQKELKKKEITRQDLLSVKQLNLNGKELFEISDLAELKNLEKLEMNGNCLTDLSPLAGLAKLRRLSASNDPFLSDAQKAQRKGKNTFRDLTPLEHLEGLTHLDLVDTGITSIDFVQALPNLENAAFYSNPISDITPIGSLKKLKRVIFFDCSVSDISVVSELPQLQGIAINCNLVEDLSPLEGCLGLTYLDAHDNKIKDLTPISKLTKIAYLTLAGNQLTDISALQDMQSLKHLTLGRNPGLKDISVVTKLKSLKVLELKDLQISDEQKALLAQELPNCDVRYDK